MENFICLCSYRKHQSKNRKHFFLLIIFRVYRVGGGDGGSVHGRYFMLMPYYLMHFSNHKIPRISVKKYKEAEITM